MVAMLAFDAATPQRVFVGIAGLTANANALSVRRSGTDLNDIRDTLAGKDDDNTFRREVDPVLQTPAEHGRCHHCA